MTANMIKGKGFRGALRYNMEKVEKGVAEILAYSFVDTSEKMIMKEIAMVKVLRPNLQKFFYHTSINFPPGEDLPSGKMKTIAQDYLEQSGFTQHQFILFRHHDAGHPHLHILVNRIGYDGKVLSDSNDFARTEKILRILEKKYQLTEVISSNQANARALTKNELEMIKRTKAPSAKSALQLIIKESLTKGVTIKEFIQKLEDKGVNVLFNQASTGYVSGISYNYKGITTTGAKLGNDFKWTDIKSNIDYDQVRDRIIISETNSRTKSVPTANSVRDHNHGDQELIQLLGAKHKTLAFGLNTKQEEPSAKSNSNEHNDMFSLGNDKHSSSSGSEKSEGLSLGSLLYGHAHESLLHANQEPDLDPDFTLGLNTKKRHRKGRRR